ncbi:MAG: ParA family protein [Planctomycetia bacterium]|nr:ParA family protein [Planctomycetia bacterium]
MTRIICVMNQKGGVGKTTTAINLGACLARAGFNTLVIDLDPQCNATSGLGEKPTDRHPFVVETPWNEAIRPTAWSCLSLLPGCRSIHDIRKMADDNPSQSERMKEHLKTGFYAFDYVLMDSPPSLSPLTRTAIECSTQVLMPIQCEFFAMEGVSKMIPLIPKEKWYESGILLTMVDPALELTYEVESEVRNFFEDVVYQTVIPRDVAVAEASSYGKPVLEYAPRSRGTRAYIELCMEVLENEQG